MGNIEVVEMSFVEFKIRVDIRKGCHVLGGIPSCLSSRSKCKLWLSWEQSIRACVE